jgi:acetyl-CoA carboxylase biotin carboxyl carrier protein
MEYKDIKRIIELMKSNDLTDFKMDDDGFRISIKRGGNKNEPTVVMSPPAAAPMMVPQAMPMQAPQVPAPAAAPVAAPAAAPVDEDAGLKDIN